MTAPPDTDGQKPDIDGGNADKGREGAFIPASATE